MDAAASHPVRATAAGSIPPEELALWQRMRTGDSGAREELRALHLPYARVVAATYYGRRYSDEVEFGDYLQYASIGLLEALERFDPQRGAQFRTFAARRMHGAILNGIECLSEKQQQIVARQRLQRERADAVRQIAEAAAGDAPARLAGERLCAYVAEVGIGLALAWLLEGTAMVEQERTEAVPFYRSAEIRQARERLLHAVEALPAQERAVIRNHYLQEISFEDIAADLGVTRGRISQIHRQALARLRSVVGDQPGVDASL